MKVRFEYNKRNNYIIAGVAAGALFLFYLSRYPLPWFFVFTGLFYLLLNIKIELNEKIPWVWTVILLFCGSIFTMLCVQHVILDAETFALTKDRILRLNVVAVSLFYLICLIGWAKPSRALITAHATLVSLAFVDHFVYEFRQNEFTVADFGAISTGIGVAGKYELSIHVRGAIVILLSALVIFFVCKLGIKFEKKWMVRVITIAPLVILSLYLVSKTKDMETQTWELKASRQNGYILNFLLEIRDMHVAEPEGYSTEAIQALEAEYGQRAAESTVETDTIESTVETDTVESTVEAKAIDRSEDGAVLANGLTANAKITESEAEAELSETNLEDPDVADVEETVEVTDNSAINLDEAGVTTLKGVAEGSAVLEEGEKPTIIAIMDESFADLTVLGDMMTSEEVMPFYKSLVENTTKGYALASVFGAKTPNSEWEFLTGNTMGFLPEGSVVYQQYIKSDATSLVSNLKNEGYEAVAMHPYYQAGWSRTTVYPNLGFDEMHFMDDGTDYFDETAIMREYITDEEMFSKIIERFEQRDTSSPLFIWGVTMQNHGGYKETFSNFTSDVTYQNTNIFPDVNQYLSLAHQTDLALKELVTYFAEVDEPVEIVFFGDHHPSLSSAFYKRVNGSGMNGLTMDELQTFYEVPFFIWTNYDTEEKNVGVTSLNYLSTLTLEKSGLEMPAYNLFLQDLMEVIPSMNARGYYSEENGKYIHYEDAAGEEKEWLTKYNILQYNSMFGKKNKSEVFFPYIIEEEDAS